MNYNLSNTTLDAKFLEIIWVFTYVSVGYENMEKPV